MRSVTILSSPEAGSWTPSPALTLCAMPLMDALRKITLMPAQRVEKAAPQMKNKGRIRVGADADITIFDAQTILDRATFTEPAQYSAGVAHVLVGGEFVVRDYAVVEGATPGKPVRGPIDSDARS